MNRMQRLKAERAAGQQTRSVLQRLRRFGVAKLLALMLGLGLVLGIATVHGIPFAVRLGMTARLADKLPYLGFASGLLIGISAAVSHAAMQALQIGLAIPLIVFAALGSLMAFVLSVLWAVATLQLLLVSALVSAIFVVAIVAFQAVVERFGSERNGRA